MVVEIVDGDLNSDESSCIIEAVRKKQITKGASMTQQDWEQLSSDEKIFFRPAKGVFLVCRGYFTRP